MRRALAGTVFVLLLATGLAGASDSDEPFGRATSEAGPGPLRATWHQIEAKRRSEMDVVRQCRTSPPSCPSPAAQRFIAIVGEGDDDFERAGRINRATNLAIKPVRAEAGPTGWTSPLETLTAGTGDCKQYAVVKYAALLEAGFAADHVRLVIVRIKPSAKPVSQPTDHAVIAVRIRSRWLVLDNRSMTMSESTGLLKDMEPLFTLDHRGVRQFMAPNPAPMAAATCSNKPA